MKCFKKILPMILLSGISSLSNAAYNESISLQRPGVNQFISVDSYNSEAPSNGVVSRLKTFDNDATQTTLFAQISSDPLPFVRTEVKNRAINDEIFSIGTGGAAVASISYDFFLQGTPNTSLALNVASIYSSSSNFGAGNFSNISFFDRIPGSFNEIGLTVGLSDSVGSTLLNYVHNCGGNFCAYTYNRFSESFIQPIATKINGVEISVSNDSTITEITPTEGVYSISGLLESSLLVQFDESGTAFGSVFIYSSSIADFVSNANAYIDPFFSIDPAYLALNPNTILSFTAGVGNDNPLAPVPEPETYAMFITGLGLVGFISRRKKHKKA